MDWKYTICSPNEAYIVVHLIALLLGAWVATRAKGAWAMLLWLYALSEVGYLLAHVGVFAPSFSHLVQEVLLLIGVIMVAMEMKK